MKRILDVDAAFGKDAALKNSWITCHAFLLIHLTYLIVFFLLKIYIMAWFNVGSVIFYMVMLILVRLDHMRIYVESTFVEVIVHMLLAIFSLGTGYGFEFMLLGMIIVMFYANYFSKRLGVNVHPVIYSIILILSTAFTYGYVSDTGPFYQQDIVYVKYIFNISHILFIFSCAAFFMYVLTEYSLRLEKQIHEASMRDGLTGLLTRNGLYDELAKKYQNSLPTDSVLAMFDIDDFKHINDTLGHNCGDYVLNTIATMCREFFENDIVVRWGGEEFIIITPNTLGNYDKFERFRELIADYNFEYLGNKFKTTITLGVSEGSGYKHLEDWVFVSDEKLYTGKKNGKNRTIF